MEEIKVNSATKDGFEIATDGDSINFSNPNSTTRRGRVGKGVAQTLDTQSNQVVVCRGSLQENATTLLEKSTSLTEAMGMGGGHIPMVQTVITDNRFKNYRDILEYHDSSPTLHAKSNEILVNNIRRLTEIECERLQGFDKSWLDGSIPENWTKYGLYPTKKITQEQFNKLPNEEKIATFNETYKKEIPKTQRYKQCGNAVMVDCVQAIGTKLFENYVIENNDTTTRG